MDYEIDIAGETLKVRLARKALEEEKEVYSATVEETPLKENELTVLSRLEDDYYVVSLNNRARAARILPGSNDEFVEFHLEQSGEGGLVIAASIAKQSSIIRKFGRPTESGGVASMSELLTANFPAKVIKVNTAQGAKLKEGDPIMVLEAMKMEAQIRAPRNCSVSEIYVGEGSMVSRGGKLARLNFA